METRRGRERRYDMRPLEGLRNADVAYVAAMLDELRERVYDQVLPLPQAALDYVAGPTQLSAGRLMLHLAWAEMNWIDRLAHGKGPEDLESILATVRLTDEQVVYIDTHFARIGRVKSVFRIDICGIPALFLRLCDNTQRKGGLPR